MSAALGLTHLPTPPVYAARGPVALMPSLLRASLCCFRSYSRSRCWAFERRLERMTTRIKIRNQVDSSVRSVSVFGSVILMSALLAAQTGVPSNVPQESSPYRWKIQKLLEAMTTQQKAMIEHQKTLAEQQQQVSKHGPNIH